MGGWVGGRVGECVGLWMSGQVDAWVGGSALHAMNIILPCSLNVCVAPGPIGFTGVARRACACD